MVKVLSIMQLKRYIGGKHTSEETIAKAFPKHLRNEAKKALKKLTQLGFIIVKPTCYGRQVSLNPRRSKEIKGFIMQNDS